MWSERTRTLITQYPLGPSKEVSFSSLHEENVRALEQKVTGYDSHFGHKEEWAHRTMGRDESATANGDGLGRGRDVKGLGKKETNYNSSWRVALTDCLADR